MSLDQAAPSLPQPINNPVTPRSGDTAARSTSAASSYVWFVLKPILGAGGVISVVGALYTYTAQQVEQRRQDFLQAFDLIDTHVGEKFITHVEHAIDPIVKTKDPGWLRPRAKADDAEALIVKLQKSMSAAAPDFWTAG
jgi:hypothetical protein